MAAARDVTSGGSGRVQSRPPRDRDILLFSFFSVVRASDTPLVGQMRMLSNEVALLFFILFLGRRIEARIILNNVLLSVNAVLGLGGFYGLGRWIGCVIGRLWNSLFFIIIQ